MSETQPNDLRQATAEHLRLMMDWGFSPAARDIPVAARRKAALVLSDNLAAIVAAPGVSNHITSRSTWADGITPMNL